MRQERLGLADIENGLVDLVLVVLHEVVLPESKNDNESEDGVLVANGGDEGQHGPYYEMDAAQVSQRLLLVLVALVEDAQDLKENLLQPSQNFLGLGNQEGHEVANP